MLEQLFSQMLNLSFTASFVILIVLIARVILQRAPKIYSYLLWGVVLFRLICPFSIESVFSLLPKNLPNSTVELYQQVTSPTKPTSSSIPSISSLTPTPVASVDPIQVCLSIGSVIWMIGIAVLLTYSIYSLVKLQRTLQHASHIKDNIYCCENLETPFVFGVRRPKIYLPPHLTDDEISYILLHEQTHIKRYDHVIKFISFVVLCIHWFNPLVWVAFFISGKDMEMSCDEAVIKQLGADIKKDYSSSLLSLATGRNHVGLTPLAFGEGETKHRIKNVLRYKVPKTRTILIIVSIVALFTIGLLVNPLSSAPLFEVADVTSADSLTRVEDATIVSSNQKIVLDDAKPIITLLESLNVNIRPVSSTRSENRSSFNQIQIQYTPHTMPTTSTKTSDENMALTLHFNKDYTEVWIDNGVKPTQTYTVSDPESIELYFNQYFLSASDLYNAKVDYVGNASAVSKLLNLLSYPSSLTFHHFNLFTTEQPYTLQITFTTSDGIVEDYIQNSDLAFSQFEKNSLLLFALIDNVDNIEWLINSDSNSHGFSFSRNHLEIEVGHDLRNYASSKETLQTLIELELE